MEKSILTEINRFKELMNLSIINEGRDDLVSDVVNSAKKVFSRATPNSAEDVFNKNIINAATDTQKLKMILASNPKLARKVLKQAIVDSGDKFFMDVEGRILYYIDSGMSSSEIKNKVEGFFDKNVKGDLKDEYIETYNTSIDLLSSGRKTSNEVFGRDVTPFQPKPKPQVKTDEDYWKDMELTGWYKQNVPERIQDELRMRVSNILKSNPKSFDEFESVVKRAFSGIDIPPSNLKKLNSFFELIKAKKGLTWKQTWNLAAGGVKTSIILVAGLTAFGLYKTAKNIPILGRLINSGIEGVSDIFKAGDDANAGSSDNSQTQETKPQETKPEDTKKTVRRTADDL